MESLGFRPGSTFALMSGLGEFVGGALVLLGFFGAVGPALVIAVMTVAILTVHIRNGFFAANKGWELPAAYIAGALAAAFTSSSLLTLDHLFGLSLFHSTVATWALVVLGVLAGSLTLVVRRLPANMNASQ